MKSIQSLHLRNGHSAIKVATHAREVTNWNLPVTIESLGMAYAEVGDFDKATEY